MRLFRFLPFSLVALALVSAGCDALSGDDDLGSNAVLLSGVVLDEANYPVPDAVVRVTSESRTYFTSVTDSVGAYEASFGIDSTVTLVVTASKDGYAGAPGSIERTIIPGDTLELSAMRLREITQEAPESGQASNILLMEQSTDHIGVKESGASEVADLTFQVTDSLGRPVVLNHAVDINFTIGVGPGGGEFLNPARVRTDNNGEATVHLSSGEAAGVVQIVAEATVGGRTLRSKPVSLTIHGGLPDAGHFSLGPERFNFPGLRRFGETNGISVIVGDQFGNPVKPGTAVYFTTSHGVIQGSVLTSDNGQGAVTLYSANPLPQDGVATITATTADTDQDPVVVRTPVVFSGSAVIDFLDPADVNAELDRTYEFAVTDGLGNPVAPGTSVSVTAEGTGVKAVGSTSFTTEDTAFRPNAFADGVYNQADVVRGPGYTEWSFRTVSDTSDAEIGSVVIAVDGPNGKFQAVLFPSGAAKTGAPLSPGVIREVLPDGRIRFRLEEK